MSGERTGAVGALDAALKKHLADLDAAEIEQVAVHAKYAEEIARLEALYAEALAAKGAAQKARMDAYYGAQDCERAIRKIGYVVLGAPGDKSHLDGRPGDFRKPIAAPTTQPAVPVVPSAGGGL